MPIQEAAGWPIYVPEKLDLSTPLIRMAEMQRQREQDQLKARATEGLIEANKQTVFSSKLKNVADVMRAGGLDAANGLIGADPELQRVFPRGFAQQNNLIRGELPNGQAVLMDSSGKITLSAAPRAPEKPVRGVPVTDDEGNVTVINPTVLGPAGKIGKRRAPEKSDRPTLAQLRRLEIQANAALRDARRPKPASFDWAKGTGYSTQEGSIRAAQDQLASIQDDIKRATGQLTSGIGETSGTADPASRGRIPDDMIRQYRMQAGGDDAKARAAAEADGWDLTY